MFHFEVCLTCIFLIELGFVFLFLFESKYGLCCIS